jgi:hypothetical protein
MHGLHAILESTQVYYTKQYGQQREGEQGRRWGIWGAAFEGFGPCNMVKNLAV